MSPELFLSVSAMVVSVATAIWVQVNTDKTSFFKHSTDAKIQILTNLSESAMSLNRINRTLLNLQRKTGGNREDIVHLTRSMDELSQDVVDSLHSLSELPSVYSKLSRQDVAMLFEAMRSSSFSINARLMRIEPMAAEIADRIGAEAN